MRRTRCQSDMIKCLVVQCTRVLVLLLLTGIAVAADELRYIHDWKWEGPAAPILLARDDGHFSAEGLSVHLEPGAGSVQAIPKVDSGEYHYGSADINSLIKYHHDNPDSDVIGVFVIYNSPPFAVIGKRSSGVVGPANLHGRALGAPAADGAFAQWPAFSKANGLQTDEIEIVDVSFADRERKLAEGEVHAITGYSFTSMLNLSALGVTDRELSLMLMSDFGLDLYGNVVIVKRAYAEQHPEQIKAFLRAVNVGFQHTIANPAAALESVLKANPEAEKARELKRLVMAIGHHIVTDEVRERGFGEIDEARLAKSIEQLAAANRFAGDIPSTNNVFDNSFLPEKAMRLPGAIKPKAPSSDEETG